MAINPADWLLTPSPAGDGKPWGTGTKMAKRAMAGPSPWDTGCGATTIIGGFAAMNEIREALETLITNASASADRPGDRGHVYIADWRFNCQRDLSYQNGWATTSWSTTNNSTVLHDQTAIGLLLRLMQAGVAVRVLVWQPTPVQIRAADLGPHMSDHYYLWSIIKAENDRLNTKLNPTVPLGIVGLDMRTADGAIAGAHHQKLVVIRSKTVNLAFCGGVDLAFTRRDAPADPANFSSETVLDGDWQSSVMPPLSKVFTVQSTGEKILWPPDGTTDYTSVIGVSPPGALLPSDLPTNTGSTKELCLAIGGVWDDTNNTCTYKLGDGTAGTRQPIYGDAAHKWHDQHLKLEGPIVSTIEWQFVERWIDSPHSSILSILDSGRGTVAFSALNGDAIIPLPDPVDAPAVAGAASVVQMWRTIPMRTRSTDLFKDGEFSIMAGISKAMLNATELIWIFDQYFWSEPTARLLNYRIKNTQNLRVIVILPPHADGTYPVIHRARQLALAELTRDLDTVQRARVAIYNMWSPVSSDKTKGVGVYVHAKAHTYDGALLVCGSANLNRRSLTCDSELSCAVVDADVVKQHQQKLWHMLFPKIATPAIDLNQAGSGKTFLTQFATAAQSNDSNLVTDPWDDDNPLNTTRKTVALPNGIPRNEALTGPKYELYYGGALDPGSMDPTIEDDIVDATNTPRAARLDDIVYNIERVYVRRGGSQPPRYPRRKQASIVRGQIIHLAGTPCFADGYQFTECAEWWKQLCAGFPCFLELGWPGYESGVVDNVTIDGETVVLQLWRGWCQRFLGINGMMGGVGAEVGVYHRVPGLFQKFVGQLGTPDALIQFFRSKVGDVPVKYFTNDFFNLADNQVWWPFTELNAKVEFTLKHATTGNVFFKAGPEKTYWMCKWMNPDDYDYKYSKIAANQAPAKLYSWDYTLEYTVTGKSSQYSGVWKKGDGTQSFPPR